MTAVRACLIDVYDTMVACDLRQHAREMAAVAGVSLESWHDAYMEVGLDAYIGTSSIAEAYARVLRAAGKTPSQGLVQRLARDDEDALVRAVHVYEDTIPFLTMLRDRGITAVGVSDCRETTRPLLNRLALSDRLDAMILSCEVGHAKPAPEIYLAALDKAGVDADAALFIDDKSACCEGAAAVGIDAVRIERSGAYALTGSVVRSLGEVEQFL